MTKVQPITNESVTSESEESRKQHLTQSPIEQILQKLSRMELPAKEHYRALHAPQVASKPQAE